MHSPSRYKKSLSADGSETWIHDHDDDTHSPAAAAEVDPDVVAQYLAEIEPDVVAQYLATADPPERKHPSPVFVRDDSATVVRTHATLGYQVITETLYSQSYYLADGDLVFTDFSATPIPMPEGDYAVLGFTGEMVDVKCTSNLP